jgi:hypothetical protein
VRVGTPDEILGFDCGGQQWVLEVAFPVGSLSRLGGWGAGAPRCAAGRGRRIRERETTQHPLLGPASALRPPNGSTPPPPTVPPTPTPSHPHPTPPHPTPPHPTPPHPTPPHPTPPHPTPPHPTPPHPTPPQKGHLLHEGPAPGDRGRWHRRALPHRAALDRRELEPAQPRRRNVSPRPPCLSAPPAPSLRPRRSHTSSRWLAAAPPANPAPRAPPPPSRVGADSNPPAGRARPRTRSTAGWGSSCTCPRRTRSSARRSPRREFDRRLTGAWPALGRPRPRRPPPALAWGWPARPQLCPSHSLPPPRAPRR